MRLKVSLILVMLSASLMAQKIVLYQNVDSNYNKKYFGPNRAFYAYQYMAYGVFLPIVDTGKSPSQYAYDFKYGSKFKFRVCEYYSIGIDINYALSAYRIQQGANKIFPDSIPHYRERFSFQSINVALFNRFNFKKRGDRLGTHFDIGGYAGWLYTGNHFTKDKTSAIANSKYTIVREKKLKYVNPYHYGAIARMGGDYISIYVNYRLSNLFKDNFVPNFAELSRITVGIEMRIDTD